VKETITTINSKGQITIPVEILKYLGLDIGDKIAFVIDSEGIVQVKVPRYSESGSLRGAAGVL
jgi:AbrB family looped-hinge helix DNA binding protein